MYSRYKDYQPFDPLENTLSRHTQGAGNAEAVAAIHKQPGRGMDFIRNFLSNLDSGDILIILLLFFLSQESGNEEILLTLALILLL